MNIKHRLTSLTTLIAALVAAPLLATELPAEAEAGLTAVLPDLRVEGGELLIQGPASRPAVLLVGPAVRSRRLADDVRLDVAPRLIVPFEIDASGTAVVPVPVEAGLAGHQVQVIVFDAARSRAVTVFPAREVAVGGGGSSQAQVGGGPGYTVSGAAGGPLGEPGGFGELCTSYCPTCADAPDGEFLDSNCDGIDGDRSRALFVDAIGGQASGLGTMTDPLNDLQFAIDLAATTPGKSHVYVSLGDYTGPIHLSDGVSVWGGFDAADGWSRAGDHDTYIHNINLVSSAEGFVALRGANIHTPTVVGDLQVEAWGGGFVGSGSGSHAIGVHLYQVSALTLERVTAIGAYADTGSKGAGGSTGSTVKSGGSGGSGGTSSSLPGSGKTGSGSSCGLGGPGGLGGAPYFNGFTGFVGVPGLPGSWGSSSFGSVSISGAQLVMSGVGGNGGDGCPGGGGGGGGGGGYAWPVGNGGKGGKGGSGGRAGLGGKGGRPAGCSVGLMLSNAQVTAIECTFAADRGGTGGFAGSAGGATAGSGGSNGQILSGLPDGGKGGTGGYGGAPGLAAPGASGHSYGVVASSSSTVDLQSSTLQATNPGFAVLSLPVGIAGEAVLFKQL